MIASADVALAAAQAPSAGGTDWTILVELTPEAGMRFEEFTGRHIGRQLAIVVDGARPHNRRQAPAVLTPRPPPTRLEVASHLLQRSPHGRA